MSLEMTGRISAKDRDKVMEETSQCQARVVQTMVPTILALGLLAVAPPGNLDGIALGCAFAIVFCSGLYVACLSFKIFRNAAFLSVFSDWIDRKDGTINFEDLIGRYRGGGRAFPIHSETTTAGIIYLALAATFFYIFHGKSILAARVCATALVVVSGFILATYYSRGIHTKRWMKVKKEVMKLHKTQGSRKT